MGVDGPKLRQRLSINYKVWSKRPTINKKATPITWKILFGEYLLGTQHKDQISFGARPNSLLHNVLKQVEEIFNIPRLLRVTNHCWIFSNALYVLHYFYIYIISTNNHIVFSCSLFWKNKVIYIDRLLNINQSCIPGINPTLLWCIVIFMYWCIQFATYF